MKNSQKNIIVSGFGGQGVLFLGTIISEACIYENKNTTWIPSYGAEMRGGSANCFVIVSNDEIASPVFDFADIGVFLSKPAFNKFEQSIQKNGLIIADSSLTGNIKNREDINYIFKPLNDILSKEKEKLLLNIVTLGVLIKETGILKKESVIEALKKVSSAKKPEFLKVNLNSFELGYGL